MTIEDIAGIWKLQGAKLSLPNGSTVLPYGEKPDGLLIVDASAALLSVHVYSAARPLAAASSPQEITPDEAAPILKGSVGYYGKIEMAGDRLITQVNASLFPNWAGGVQERTVRLEGNILALSADLPGGADITLTWEPVRTIS